MKYEGDPFSGLFQHSANIEVTAARKREQKVNISFLTLLKKDFGQVRILTSVDLSLLLPKLVTYMQLCYQLLKIVRVVS